MSLGSRTTAGCCSWKEDYLELADETEKLRTALAAAEEALRRHIEFAEWVAEKARMYGLDGEGSFGDRARELLVTLRTTAARPKEIELWAKSVNGGHPTSRCARYALDQEARAVAAEEALREVGKWLASLSDDEAPIGRDVVLAEIEAVLAAIPEENK